MPHVYADALQNQQLAKLKIEPAMISFVEYTTSSKMAHQTNDFIMKESCKFFFCFFEFQTSGQNAGNS